MEGRLHREDVAQPLTAGVTAAFDLWRRATFKFANQGFDEPSEVGHRSSNLRGDIRGGHATPLRPALIAAAMAVRSSGVRLAWAARDRAL